MTWCECPWHKVWQSQAVLVFMWRTHLPQNLLARPDFHRISGAHAHDPRLNLQEDAAPFPLFCCSLIWLPCLIWPNPASIIFICAMKPGGSFLIFGEERHLLNYLLKSYGEGLTPYFWLDEECNIRHNIIDESKICFSLFWNKVFLKWGTKTLKGPWKARKSQLEIQQNASFPRRTVFSEEKKKANLIPMTYIEELPIESFI